MRLGSVNSLIEYYTDQCLQTKLSVEGCHQSADISTGGSCLCLTLFWITRYLLKAKLFSLKLKYLLFLLTIIKKVKTYCTDLIVIIIVVTEPITVKIFIK